MRSAVAAAAAAAAGYSLGPGSGVEFLPGFFNETLGPGSAPHGIDAVALLRVDVDTYEGTVDVLRGLYDSMASALPPNHPRCYGDMCYESFERTEESRN